MNIQKFFSFFVFAISNFELFTKFVDDIKQRYEDDKNESTDVKLLSEAEDPNEYLLPEVMEELAREHPEIATACDECDQLESPDPTAAGFLNNRGTFQDIIKMIITDPDGLASAIESIKALIEFFNQFFDTPESEA